MANVYGFRHLPSGQDPSGNAEEMTAGGAIAYGAVVTRSGTTGKVTACADAATSAYGWCVSVAAADGDPVKVVPAYPGVRALMDIKGTYSAAQLGSLIALDVTGGECTAEVDNAGADLFKFCSRVQNIDGVYRAWVEIPAAISEACVEI